MCIWRQFQMKREEQPGSGLCGVCLKPLNSNKTASIDDYQVGRVVIAIISSRSCKNHYIISRSDRRTVEPWVDFIKSMVCRRQSPIPVNRQGKTTSVVKAECST